jgi:putative ABC transport system permease protein
MRFAKLIFRNLFRNKVRTFLTIALMSAIFFFVATLLSILANFEQASNAGEGQNRLGVQSSISLGNMLPYTHEEKIKKIPGVVAVTKMQWMGAYYKDQKNFFANFAMDHETMDKVFDDYKTSPEEMAAFKSNRRAAIVGPGLAKRFGWKLGDKVVLTGTIFPFNPEVVVAGIYDHKIDDSSFFIRMDYFQESLGNPSQVGMFWAKIDKPQNMEAIGEQIDAMFANSEFPTETLTEKAFQQQFIAMIGNIKLLFTTISLCAIFMVILLAALTMSMSARERVTEIAVLKAIGFKRGQVLGLMLFEFVLIALIGGAVGVFGARLAYRAINMTELTQGFLVAFSVNNETTIICMIASLLVGLIAGGLPAMRSANIPVVDGLRKVV